jgi:hypothetical protein
MNWSITYRAPCTSRQSPLRHNVRCLVHRSPGRTDREHCLDPRNGEHIGGRPAHRLRAFRIPGIRQTTLPTEQTEPRGIRGDLRTPRNGAGLALLFGVSMSIDLEYACRSRLKWKRDGSDWVLLCGRRWMGRVVPDSDQPGMYRSVKSGGRLSDMASLSWNKDAVLDAAIRDQEWEARHKVARDPSKCPENGGLKSTVCPSIHANDLAATPIAGRVS